MSSLKGKSVDEVRSLLRQAKFNPVSNGPADQEIWYHADRSVVRIAQSSGTGNGARTYLQVKKEIADVGGNYLKENIVAKVTDSGFVVPRDLKNPADLQRLNQWFQANSASGKGPRDWEFTALTNAWGIATHIPLAPYVIP
jgi:hypothetical protein